MPTTSRAELTGSSICTARSTLAVAGFCGSFIAVMILVSGPAPRYPALPAPVPCVEAAR